MKTLLVIFAHPDDESHGPAGTLAKYAHQGVRVHYLCATRGEAGTVDSHFLQDGSSIAELRTRELTNAAAELGIASVHFLDYRDSGMEGSADNHHPESLFSAPVLEVAQKIAEYIRLFRPDAIITHDEYGWYGHPDHIKCYQATLLAYGLLFGLRIEAGVELPSLPTVPRLYASSFPKFFLRIMVRLMPFFGKDPCRHGQNEDVNLVKIASWNVPLTTRIWVGNSLDAKDKAVACHESQRPLVETKYNLIRILLRQTQVQECFYRLYPPVCPREKTEFSLFDPNKDKISGSAMPSVA